MRGEQCSPLFCVSKMGGRRGTALREYADAERLRGLKQKPLSPASRGTLKEGQGVAAGCDPERIAGATIPLHDLLFTN